MAGCFAHDERCVSVLLVEALCIQIQDAISIPKFHECARPRIIQHSITKHPTMTRTSATHRSTNQTTTTTSEKLQHPNEPVPDDGRVVPRVKLPRSAKSTDVSATTPLEKNRVTEEPVPNVGSGGHRGKLPRTAKASSLAVLEVTSSTKAKSSKPKSSMAKSSQAASSQANSSKASTSTSKASSSNAKSTKASSKAPSSNISLPPSTARTKKSTQAHDEIAILPPS